MENKNFQDITGKSYIALAAGYGIEGQFPIDLRTVLPGFTMLENLIHCNMAYEGMLVYIAGTIYICKPKFHSAVWNPDGYIAVSKGKYYLDEELTQPITDGTASGTTVYSNMLWYEEYQVTSQQVEKATEASKLDHNVVINGKTTNFALNAGEDVTTIDTGLFTPETIEAGTNIDTITHCGFYSYTDADSANNYSLLIEKIGDKLYRTKISIENGVPVIETSVGTVNEGVVTWSAWVRLSVGKSITSISSINGVSIGGQSYVQMLVNVGSTPELWVYSEPGAQYPSGYANIHTADGQVFTIGSQSAGIPHPFLIKLKTADNGTRTATVESLKASTSRYGLINLSDTEQKGTSAQMGIVKLSDSLTDSANGENKGVASTPKAAYDLNVKIENEATARANADSTLQDNIDTKAPINHASTATTYGKGDASNYGHVKLSNSIATESGVNDGVAATPAAVKTVNDNLLTHSELKAGTGNLFGHVSVRESNGLSVVDGNVRMAAAYGSSKGAVALTNVISKTNGDASGTAATPKAVYTAVEIAVMGFMGMFQSKKAYFGECSGSAIEQGGSTDILTIDWIFGGNPASFGTNDLVILKFTNTTTFQLNNKFIKTTNGDLYIIMTPSEVWTPQNGEIWSFIHTTGMSVHRIKGNSLIQ